MSTSTIPLELQRYISDGVEVLYFEHWSQVTKGDWPWKNFTPRERACKRTGSLLLVPEYMERLQGLRTRLKRAMPVNSGFRSVQHNQLIGGGLAHPTGRADDIGIFGNDALELVIMAREEGFTGIGVKQHGGIESRFIHLDDLQNDETRGPRPWLWSY
ncbi:MAG: D-Ala-D-Ala carboxypeptidase family metallohydrolase [Pseudomonadota bacterium]